jgi:hypothetical protein
MKFAVETWAPEYGASVDDTDPAASSEPVDVNVEVDAADWAPRTPPPLADPGAVRFVDGVRRIEARIWITEPGGSVHQGICASYGAGVVRCDGRATIESAEVRRAVFSRAEGAEPVVTRHGTFAHEPVATDAPDQLSVALQGAMADLEHEVSVAASRGSLLVVVSAPAGRDHPRLGGGRAL